MSQSCAQQQGADRSRSRRPSVNQMNPQGPSPPSAAPQQHGPPQHGPPQQGAPQHGPPQQNAQQQDAQQAQAQAMNAISQLVKAVVLPINPAEVPGQLASAFETGVNAYNELANGSINRDFMPQEKQLGFDKDRMELKREQMNIVIQQKDLIRGIVDAIPELGKSLGNMVHGILEQRIQRRYIPRMVEVEIAKMQMENEERRMKFTQARFNLIRDYLLLQSDLREMAQYGYPLRYMSQLSAPGASTSNAPHPGVVPYRIMAGYNPRLGYVPLVVAAGGSQSHLQRCDLVSTSVCSLPQNNGNNHKERKQRAGSGCGGNRNGGGKNEKVGKKRCGNNGGAGQGCEQPAQQKQQTQQQPKKSSDTSKAMQQKAPQPQVPKVPDQKPRKEQCGPSPALINVYMTAEEHHDFMQWQEEKEKDGQSQALKTGAKEEIASNSKGEKPAGVANKENKPFPALGLDGKVRWYKNEEEYEADHGPAEWF